MGIMGIFLKHSYRIGLWILLGLLGSTQINAQTATPQPPFIVKDIRVEGLRWISTGTVLTYLPIQINDTVNTERLAQAIQALFKTGFFKDVALSRDGDALIVTVVERPAIADIKISGNKDIETDKLLEALKEIGLATGQAFNESLLDKIEQELERQYHSRGKYGVSIKSTISALPRNRVQVSIDITEGKAAKIRQIKLIGNTVFSDKILLKQFQLASTGWLSFYTGDDQYSRPKLTADLEALRSYYLDRGYINFQIKSTQVSITPDKEAVYITINIDEGQLFKVREVKLAGKLVLPEAELIPLISIAAGDVFSRKQSTETSTRIGRKLGDQGYAFANVNTIPEIDNNTHQVTLTFFIDPGKRTYVRRINLQGNTRTVDEVIRREIRQMENAWISTEQVERSKTRLNRLGYFEDVTVETPAVPGTTDQVDVNFTIEEKPSGNIMAGLGYSQSQGILINASVKEDNFLGTGKRVNFSFNNSNVNTIYSIGYLNPYYTLDGVSRGFNVFFRETDAAEANLSNYATDTYGGNVSYGLPINEFDRLQFELGYEHLRIKSTESSPQEVVDFIAANGEEFDTFKLTASWAHDTRNRAIFADRGLLQRFSLEATVPGSDLEYYKASYRQLLLYPLTKHFTLSINTDLGYGDSYGNLDRLPFFENYFAGGVRSVRGYEDNTLGPLDSKNNALGGALKVVGNFEVIFPVPFFAEQRSVRLSTFIDVGNVYAGSADFSAAELRYSAGLSAIWLSPLGALTFSLAQPFNDAATDSTQVFQFTLGSAF